MKWLETLVGEAHDQLDDRVLEAFWSRGVSDSQISQYQLGYLDKYLPSANYPEHFIKWWKEKPRDDVFVFPLTNTLGHVRGIQLRHVEEDRKGYTDYIADREEPVLFGLSQAMESVWDSGAICLVEGNFDLFPIQRHFPNVVSTLHAGVPVLFWRTLRRLVERLYLIYDNDYTGRSVSFEIAKEHRGDYDIQIFKFPQVPYRDRLVKDPSELWEVWGDDRLGVYLRDHLKPNSFWRSRRDVKDIQ